MVFESTCSMHIDAAESNGKQSASIGLVECVGAEQDLLEVEQIFVGEVHEELCVSSHVPNRELVRDLGSLWGERSLARRSLHARA